MELELDFLWFHQKLHDVLKDFAGGLPQHFDNKWLNYIIRVDRVREGQDPTLYHLINGFELHTLSPRLWKAAHGLSLDHEPFLSQSLRMKRYHVVADSLHPLKDYASVIQLFALVAPGNWLPFLH